MRFIGLLLLQTLAVVLFALGVVNVAGAATWQCTPGILTAACPTVHTCDDYQPCETAVVEIPGVGPGWTICLCSNTPQACIPAA